MGGTKIAGAVLPAASGDVPAAVFAQRDHNGCGGTLGTPGAGGGERGDDDDEHRYVFPGRFIPFPLFLSGSACVRRRYA